MSARRFDEFDNEIEEFEPAAAAAPVVPEASPSTKLERRRKIEDLFEEKRLREELGGIWLELGTTPHYSYFL